MTTNLLDGEHVTVLLRFARGTIVFTAEHHRNQHGHMNFTLHVQGGKYNDLMIHCATEQSVTRLFNVVVGMYKLGVEHPYIAN